MELTPQLLAEVEFRDTLRGYDRDEVDTFLEQVGVAIAQLQGRLREAIARAEVAESRSAQGGDDVTTETITRTLLLAQRTADATVAEAETDARRLVDEAQDEASRLRSEAEADRSAVLAETENEARQVAEQARKDLLAELEDLQARRDGLRTEVDALGAALEAERSRLLEAAGQLTGLVERGVLGDEPAADARHADGPAPDIAEPAIDGSPIDGSPIDGPAPDIAEPAIDEPAIDEPAIDIAEPAIDEPVPAEVASPTRTGDLDAEPVSVTDAQAGDDEPDIDLSDADDPDHDRPEAERLSNGDAGAPAEPAPGASVFGDGTGAATQAVDVLAIDDDDHTDDVFVQQLRDAVSPTGEGDGETMTEFFDDDTGPRRLFGRDSD